MICRLCLKDYQELIHIFDVVGLELNVAMVLGKYFWFEPKSDDPISTAICNDCWTQVSHFHEFYLHVEEAHRLLTERFSIKTEEKTYQRHEKQATATTTTIAVEKLSKSEPKAEKTVPDRYSKPMQADVVKKAVDADDDGDGADDDGSEMEIQFSILLSEEEEDDSEEITLNASASEEKDQLATENNISNTLDENTLEQKFGYNDETSFDEQFFVERVLEGVQHMEEEEDKLIIKEEPVDSLQQRRTTRRSKTNTNEDQCIQQTPDEAQTSILSEQPKLANCEETKKIKGRPRKRPVLTIQPKCKKTLLTTAQCHAARELKSQANDDKISDYMRLLCHVCGEELPTFARLRSHVAQLHQQSAYAICCNKKFYKRVLLVEHIDKHLDPECYKCVDCNKIFADKQCLRNHMLLKHQPDEVKNYECAHCPKKFAKPYLLEQHLIVHAARNHICEVCQRGFPSAPQLGCHMKMAHTSTYGTMCHICAKVIRGRAAFERHQLEHTGVQLPKVQCEKCGSWHKDKYSLQKHRRRHNEDGTLHICHICRKEAPNRSALLSHFRYVHAAKRTYECSVCKKAFKKPLNLKEHMTMHTGEVLYSCPHCPKTFNSNANMHSHRKKMHPREFEEQRQLRRGNPTEETSEEQPICNNAEEVSALLPAEALTESNAVSILFTDS